MIGTEVLNKIKEAEIELDKLNLMLAQWRLEHGMQPNLVPLYKKMGELSRALQVAEGMADLSDYIRKLGDDSEKQ